MPNHRFMPTAPKTPLEFGSNGRPLCRNCRGSVPPYRFTYCSDKCVEAWRIRTDGNFVRAKVFQRDKGVCANCRLDTRALKDAIFEATGDYFGVRSQWQAHHMVGVSEGGGLCDLRGYATLCLLCHAKETARQRAARDEARRQHRKHQILRFLETEDWGATTQEVVKATRLSKSSASEYLKQMREEGLVYQSQRKSPFFVTSAGIATLLGASTHPSHPSR